MRNGSDLLAGIALVFLVLSLALVATVNMLFKQPDDQVQLQNIVFTETAPSKEMLPQQFNRSSWLLDADLHDNIAMKCAFVVGAFSDLIDTKSILFGVDARVSQVEMRDVIQSSWVVIYDGYYDIPPDKVLTLVGGNAEYNYTSHNYMCLMDGNTVLSYYFLRDGQ